jgi:hypothetical protein
LVVVPGSTLFIAGAAFPRSCTLTLAGSDCNSEFRAWDRGRQLGSSEAFERRTSGMRELTTKESGDSEGKTQSGQMGKLD